VGLPDLAQLEERWTVMVSLHISTGRWFDSSNREVCFECIMNFSFIACLSQAYRKLIASLSQAYRKLIASLLDVVSVSHSSVG
jgi:hypothetical protein